MKKVLSIALVLVLTSMCANAVETLISGCEDTNFAVTIGGLTPNDTISLANSTTASEGTNSLEVTYDYKANAGAWYQSQAVSATFATPIDISDMEFLKVDINVSSGGSSNFYSMVYFVDEYGYTFRAELTGALEATSPGWNTYSCKISAMDNSMWVASGYPANMAKISQVQFRIMNDAQFTADGTLVFLLDNIRFASDTGYGDEVVIEDFESYADVAAADIEWASAFNRDTTTALDTANPYAGTKSYTINTDLNTGKWVNWGRMYTFSAAQDWSTVKYIKLGVYGDADLAGYNPTAHLALKDSAGNMAFAFVYGWPANAEWSTMFLTFNGVGVAADSATAYIWREFAWDAGGDIDLSSIVNMYLLIETQVDGSGYPVDTTIGFDNITLGYATQDEPIPSDQQYNVGKCAVAPTIDGVISAGEWADAGSQVCTGFVMHDNPSTAATEDPEVKIMYDDTNLYLCWEVANSVLNQDFSPSSPGDDVDSAGDKFPMYFTPDGTMADGFYRISLVPNPGDSTMYMWDEAATSGNWPGVASWNADNDSGAFSYSGGVLIMEYQIPWTDFDLSGLVQTGAPADGTKWGAQLCFSNSDLSESVNWEPDETAGYVTGRPFGEITFTGSSLPVVDWAQY